MGDFFLEGGWGMYPVLVWGLILLVSAGRLAGDADTARLRFLAVGTVAHLAFIVGAVTINVATVFKYLESSERVPDGMLARVLLEGLKESSRPAILGLFLLGLAFSLAAVGAFRAQMRQRG